MSNSRQERQVAYFIKLAESLFAMLVYACMCEEGAGSNMGGGGQEKRNLLLVIRKHVSTSSVVNPHMKWERDSFFF